MPGSCAWTNIYLTPHQSCPPVPDPAASVVPTIAGLVNFVAGNPPSLTASYTQLPRPDDLYKWVLEEEVPVGSGAFYPRAVTQDVGPTGDSYSHSNQTWTPKLAGNVDLPPGHYRLQTMVAGPWSQYPGCFWTHGHSGLYTFDVLPAGASVSGLAPGVALAGDADLALYGTGLAAGSAVSLAGPVYALADLSNPLCDLGTGSCPASVVAASSGTGGATLSFAVPSSLQPGYYFTRARDGSTDSGNGAWLRVEVPQKTYPVVPPAQHNTAPRIYPGQEITGTFAAGGDATGTFEDYNTFYFVATAGSTVSASLERVDTSLSWENPASIDPQLEIVAPDGLIYENLRQMDDQPGVDYNASLSGAVLPQTGIYFLRAGTMKGSGAYRLNFSLDSVAPAPASSRAIPLSGNFNTVLAGTTTVTAVAHMLDPRGYPISGAAANFAVVPGADDTGTLAFVTSPSTVTSTDGLAWVSARVSTPGKVQFSPSFSDPLLALWVLLDEKGQRLESAVPRYAPVGIWAITPQDVDEDGTMFFEEGRREELAAPRRMSSSRKAGDSGAERSNAQSGPVPISQAATKATEAVTSCSAAIFVEAGVNAPQVRPPFAVTLTDLTPSTGQSQPNGVVDTATGIHGHRIEKTIRMKIDITDATGVAPTYPVLVHLSIAGPFHGKLILDPDGNRVECDQASFLWHERDAQGNIIALNEEFEYELGTFAPYVGAIPDAGSPGGLKPVWGTGEALGLVISTMDGSGTTTHLSRTFGVHLEPGKPDHLAVAPPKTPSDPAEWIYWTGAAIAANGTLPGGAPKLVHSETDLNRYYLYDAHGNVTYGYTSESTTPPSAPNLTISFFDQLIDMPSGSSGDPNSYGWQISWDNTPSGQFPSGEYTATLTVNYANDPDWSEGIVSKPVTFKFEGGSQHFLAAIDGWDCLPPLPTCVAYDPPFPWIVSPGARDDGLPKSVNDPDPLYVTSTIDAARVAFVIGSGTAVAAAPFPVFDGTNALPETTDNPTFKVSLVDHANKVAAEAEFLVHLCPRYDHFVPQGGQPRACETTPFTSTQGVVPSVQVNIGSGMAATQAYMGVELTKGPADPGEYYIKFEAVGGAQYRVREFADVAWDFSPAGENQGAWHLLTVAGGEILDENFARISPIPVTGPTTAYVLLTSTDVGASIPMTLRTTREDGEILSQDIQILLNRVGHSNQYIAPFTLVPEDLVESVRVSLKQSASGPDVEAAVGLTKIAATSATLTVLGLAKKEGRPRLRFMVRDQLCTTTIDDSCLTAPDPMVPGDPPGRRQETYIDPSMDYAERVRLLIDIVNEQGQPVPGIRGSVTVTEKRNPVYFEGDLGKTDGTAKYQLFYDGKYGAADLQSGVKVSLVNGRGMLPLSAAAPARYLDGQAVATTLPYQALLRIAATNRFHEMPQFVVGHWVDERIYTRNRNDLNGGWIEPSPGQVTRGPDWVEMKTGDLLALTTSAPGAVPESDAVLKKVDHAVTDLFLAGAGQVSEFVPAEVRLRPFLEMFRREVTWGGSWLYQRAGLQQRQTFSGMFAWNLWHEARHSWIYQLGLSDADGDFLPVNPPASSLGLTDGPFGTNPEAEFRPTFADRDDPSDRWRQTVFERNAVRFAAANSAAPGGWSCDVPVSFGATLNGSVLTITAQAQAVDGQGTTAAYAAANLFLEVYSRTGGSGCNFADGSWSLLTRTSTDSGGTVTLSVNPAAQYGVRWRRPGECVTAVVDDCAP
jgi:hypothetical protein